MFLLKHNILDTVKMTTAERMTIYRKTILVLLISVIMGCASFPDYRIGKIDAITASKEPISKKPSGHLSIKSDLWYDVDFNSKSDHWYDIHSNSPLPILKQIVEKTANESGIFQSLTFESLQSINAESVMIFQSLNFESIQAKNVDYILQIKMAEFGSRPKFEMVIKDWRLFFGLYYFNTYTLFVVPSCCESHNYTLSAQLYNRHGKLLKTYSYDDSRSTWLGILLLPLAWKTAKYADQELWGNMIRALFRDLVKENILVKP